MNNIGLRDASASKKENVGAGINEKHDISGQPGGVSDIGHYPCYLISHNKMSNPKVFGKTTDIKCLTYNICGLTNKPSTDGCSTVP